MSADPSDAFSEGMHYLPIDKIMANPQNPRIVFPQPELDRLADSIDQIGIRVPIVVYPKGEKYELVDGERRFLCAQTLGLKTIPAVITDEKSDLQLLQEMFNIHLIREPWRDIPTAKAVQRLAEEIKAETGVEPNDSELRQRTGLSLELVRRLRYVVTLPEEWQKYIADEKIPLNFFWELKRYVIDPLANLRPELLAELSEDRVMNAFVQKRLDRVITDTISLRDVAAIIRYSKIAESEGGSTSSHLDDAIRDLVENEETTIEEVYEDTVQTMVEADKLERRTETMVAAFARLLAKSSTEADREKIRAIGANLIRNLTVLVSNSPDRDEQAT